MFIAVEMMGSLCSSPGSETEIHVNDTGYYRATKEQAWGLVKDVFSKEHTIILDEDGKVYPVE